MNNYELADEVIGCAREVHQRMGPGHAEWIYRDALAYELTRSSIHFEVEAALQTPRRTPPGANSFPDFLVESCLVLDVRATGLTRRSDADHPTFELNGRSESGLILDFGARHLIIRKKYRTLNPPQNW